MPRPSTLTLCALKRSLTTRFCDSAFMILAPPARSLSDLPVLAAAAALTCANTSQEGNDSACDAAPRPRLGLWPADIVQTRRLRDSCVVAVARLQRIASAPVHDTFYVADAPPRAAGVHPCRPLRAQTRAPWQPHGGGTPPAPAAELAAPPPRGPSPAREHATVSFARVGATNRSCAPCTQQTAKRWGGSTSQPGAPPWCGLQPPRRAACKT